ncbi:MAG: hypothetical protein IKR57_04545 [Bacilli bacterium]|nr:hypothetical protein [Bacilli bacterium]
MKESMWGYLIIALGVVIIAILVFVQRLTTINEEDYHLSREIMKASMLDAVDYGSYMKTGKLVMSKEKFVAVFTRRFAESVTPDKTYTLNFYDIHEYPPKATVRIVTNSGETSINGNGIDLDLNTFISAILVTSEADGLINISISAANGDINGDGELNPKDILAAINCYSGGSCSNTEMLSKLDGDFSSISLSDLVILEQGMMHGYNFGDINKDRKVGSEDVTYIRTYKKNNKHLDLFQIIVGDINRDGKVANDDASALEDIISSGKMTIVKGDVNGDGMITASDALLIKDHLNTNVILSESQLKVADINGDGKVDNSDVNSIVTNYKNYLKKVIEN